MPSRREQAAPGPIGLQLLQIHAVPIIQIDLTGGAIAILDFDRPDVLIKGKNLECTTIFRLVFVKGPHHRLIMHWHFNPLANKHTRLYRNI